MTNNDQIRKIIRQIVQEEIRRELPSALATAFTGLVVEALQTTTPRKTSKPLNEVSYGSAEELEPYPEAPVRQRPDRGRLAELMGLGDIAPTPIRHGPSNQLIVSAAHTENGTAIPVDPSTLPDHVVRALTRDYSDVMAELKKRKMGG
jgi:hypothetical protein